MNEPEVKTLISILFNTELQTFKLLTTLAQLMMQKGHFTVEEFNEIYNQVQNTKDIMDAEAIVSLLAANPINGGKPA